MLLTIALPVIQSIHQIRWNGKPLLCLLCNPPYLELCCLIRYQSGSCLLVLLEMQALINGRALKNKTNKPQSLSLCMCSSQQLIGQVCLTCVLWMSTPRLDLQTEVETERPNTIKKQTPFTHNVMIYIPCCALKS